MIWALKYFKALPSALILYLTDTYLQCVAIHLGDLYERGGSWRRKWEVKQHTA